MQRFFVLPQESRSESVVDKTISKEDVGLDNGYTISVSRERISNGGRSIYRGIDQEQIVIKILDENGKVTHRLPIPAAKGSQIGALISHEV